MPDFTVDTTSDGVDAHDGVLSLREALARADATVEADAILFSDAVQGGTIVLAGSQLTVASDVTIDGGSGVTLDGNRLSRVLFVQGTGTDVALERLTITGGYAGIDPLTDTGGGIRAEDGTALSLDHVTVSGNFSRAGGGIDGDSIRLVDSLVSANGVMALDTAGGIRGRTVELLNSAVTDNRGGTYGGGISAETVSLSASTVSDNHVLMGRGGGIFATTATLTNSTVWGNSAERGGGGIAADSVALTNCTVSGNSAVDFRGYGYGGGIAVGRFDGHPLTITNSIVAGNLVGPNGYYQDVAADIGVSNGHNIFGSDVSGNVAGDLENVSPSLLFTAGLADNGGPTPTLTLRDALDNPALAGGDPTDAPTTDQRGMARPQPDGTNPDIGALELEQSASPPLGTSFTVTTAGDTIADDGVLSLREALALTDADPVTADTILFDLAAMGGDTIVLGGSQLVVGSDVTIDGGSGVTVDAGQLSRVLLVRGDFTDVSLAHLMVTGGRTTGEDAGGGGIRAELRTSLTLDQVTVVANSTDSSGGGIHADGSLTVTGSTISGNVSAVGGGIWGNGPIVLTGSAVMGNSTAWDGGRIFGGIITLTDSTISGNTATQPFGGGASGGGIFAEAALSLTGCTVSDNRSDSFGGGIAGSTTVAAMTLSNTTISGNSTGGNGGGIFASAATSALLMSNCTVSGNSVEGFYGGGGGIAADYVPLTIANSIIAGNSVTGVSSYAPNLHGTIESSNGANIFGSEVRGSVAGDLENVASATLFAAIDPTTGGGMLGDNGGPTRTIALRDAADNPALGAADPADAPATDQRGVTRPQPAGTSSDIGAFELDQMGGPPNEIVGTDRGEFLSGTRGADLIRGLGGDDRLWARPGDDLLQGDAGRDVLAGKAGIDRMTGGADADRFLFRRPTDAPDGPNHDEILDFSRAEGDRIDLRPMDARPGAAGDQAFAFIGQQVFTGAGQLRYQATADGGFLVSGNTGGDLEAEFAFVVRTGLADLKEADFLL